LRYEYNSPPVDAFDRANIYDPATRRLAPVGTAAAFRAAVLSFRQEQFRPAGSREWWRRRETL
jgi:hypothetical protein